MHFSTFLLLSTAAAGVVGDFVGPTYPAPFDLTSKDSHVRSAWKNVSSTFQRYISDKSKNESSPSGIKSVTFSAGLFSIHDPAASTLQFHHTSADIASSKIGVKKVDGNSIYRVASMTKLLTVYAGMLVLKASDWDRPITDFVPSLAAYALAHPPDKDRTRTVDWDTVTLAALGSQMAGNPRDVMPWDGDYLLQSTFEANSKEFGFPPLNTNDPLVLPVCYYTEIENQTCTANNYATGSAARPPLFLPWTSPAYSDYAYMLLGVAISNITGKSIHDIYSESIFSPLSMASSSSKITKQTDLNKYVVAGELSAASMNPTDPVEVTIPSGGMLSTTNDLAKWGIGMLNSTLMADDETRKWMKPVSHTAMLEYALGRPWEIYRYTHPDSGHITDIYTKLGDSGNYGSYMALIPEYDAGFSVISASPNSTHRSAMNPYLADIIIEEVMPALTAQARTEAKTKFAGTYLPTDKKLNTSLTIGFSGSTHPGLVITNFISNGTNVLVNGGMGKAPVRILPSIADLTNNQIAFRTSPLRTPAGGLFKRQFTVNEDWVQGDAPTYGGIGVGLFTFDLDANGNAVAASPAAWRVKLVKKS